MDSGNAKKHVLITLVGKSEPSPSKIAESVIQWRDDKMRLARETDWSSVVLSDLFEYSELRHEDKDCGEYTEASLKDTKGRDFIRRSWKESETKTYYMPKDEGNILAFCRERKPDIVFMFPTGSKDSGKKGGEQTTYHALHVQDVIKGLYPDIECHVLPLEIEHVKDVKDIYKEFRRRFTEMREILKSDGSEADYIFSLLTSIAAPDMRTAVKEYISTTNLEPKFYSVHRPQDAEPGCRVEEVKQDIERAADLMTDIDDDIHNYRFDVLSKNMREISNLSVLPVRRELAGVYIDVFRAYSDMDRMDYGAALPKIEWALQRFGELYKEYACDLQEEFSMLAERLFSVLEMQKAYLDGLRENKQDESVNNLIDLYFNIERSYTRGNYADVLSRFWRLREGVLNLRLKKKGFDVRDLNSCDKKLVKALEKYEENKYKYKSGKFKVYNFKTKKDGTYDRYEGNIEHRVNLLRYPLDDRQMAEFEERYGQKLYTLKSNRNHTIVAHGMLPVSKSDAQSCRDIGKNMIEMFDLIEGGKKVYEEYPFKLEHLKLFSQILKVI